MNLKQTIPTYKSNLFIKSVQFSFDICLIIFTVFTNILKNRDINLYEVEYYPCINWVKHIKNLQ